jgi:hypothetical protein
MAQHKCKHCGKKTFLTYFHTCKKEKVPIIPTTFVLPDSWYDSWNKDLIKKGWTKKELKQGWRYIK